MIGAFALSRARARRHNRNPQVYRRYRRRRTQHMLGAQAIFQNALNSAPTSRRGKICMKWNHQTRNFDTSTFINSHMLTEVNRSVLDNVRISPSPFSNYNSDDNQDEEASLL